MQKHPHFQRLEQDMATEDIDREKDPSGGIEQRRLNIPGERDAAVDGGVPKRKACVADCLEGGDEERPVETFDVGVHVHSGERRQVFDPEEVCRQRRQTHNGSSANCEGCQGSPPDARRRRDMEYRDYHRR